MPIGEVIAQAGRNSLGLGTMLAHGIDASRFARFASGQGGLVHSNHPAFIYGHLTMYPSRICERIGVMDAATEIAAPENWKEIFEAGVECRDDPDGSIYPPMSEIMARFQKSHERLLEVVAATPDDVYNGPNPNEAMRERLGLQTLGASVNFMLTSHAMLHLGQVSAWRRFEGLGSVM